MSSLFRSKNNNQKPDYTGLQLQTSSSTLPIPILYGKTKVSGNLIWYNNFQVHVQQGGGKGHGGKGGMMGGGAGSASYTYTYTADLMLALCEGVVNALTTAWKDQGEYPLYYLGLGLSNGWTPQTPWAYLTTFYPSQALGYNGTAWVGAAQYDLGASATIGNLNFEIEGLYFSTGFNGLDADPAFVIYDFLTNAQYGCGFNPASIDYGSLVGTAGSLSYFCTAMGIAFSPVLTSQESAAGILQRWLKLTNCGAVWSAGVLKFIPYGDTLISAGAQWTRTASLSIPRPAPTSEGVVYAFVNVSTAAQFVLDSGVVYAHSGTPFAFIGAAIPTFAGTYGMIVPGTYIFTPADELIGVIITYTTQSLSSFTPNITAVAALTDHNFIDEKGSKDPVQVERADIFSLPTIQRIECSSRINRYAPVPVEARDQSMIDTFGPRVGSVIQAHEICDEFTVGQNVAQAILQRELYVRTKFSFKLSWEFCLLDPMDVVTITDPNLGLSNSPVRIIEIQEDDAGLLTITAEELVQGIATAATYSGSSAGSYLQNQGMPAIAVNPPLIYEPPPAGTGNTPQLWVGASASNIGVAGQWGGANVFVSVDDVTYSQIAKTTSALRQGVTTSAISYVDGWDTHNTLTVDLSESAGVLSGTSMAAAQAGATLALIDDELIAYENATLVTGNVYNLTGLARGLGGTLPVFHAAGAQFARIDGAAIKYDLPPSLLARVLYLKFQSFNAFGLAAQDLSTCAVYTYTPLGFGTTHPILQQLQSGIALDLGDTSTPIISDDFGGSGLGAIISNVDLGLETVHHVIVDDMLAGILVDLGAVVLPPTELDDLGAVSDPVVDSVSLGTVP